jgi:hypothetical protein
MPALSRAKKDSGSAIRADNAQKNLIAERPRASVDDAALRLQIAREMEAQRCSDATRAHHNLPSSPGRVVRKDESATLGYFMSDHIDHPQAGYRGDAKFRNR